MENTTLNVEGMTCAHCKQAVTGALKDLNGVTDVDVNLDSGKVDVTYDTNRVDIKQMEEAVEEQGYDIA
ncbi:copper chaperone CopZ [Tuberibacillus sp. Marseille-P3662]|uniref:copper chaperone CopZ n=1 Tax=Tuberibacillus sp. Marseille-P3662 TaxID=1965358 RepID=UPI000A1CDBE7|nr:copper chaperone CopZ [Tuberibacillus sp. Marseille-P3662]